MKTQDTGSHPGVSDAVEPGWGLRVCVSKFLGRAQDGRTNGVLPLHSSNPELLVPCHSLLGPWRRPAG